jgi:PIN domain nuclease of toxin-antitoxin system
MIILDTHIWIWWLHDTIKLSTKQKEEIKKNENRIIGISAITCWEIAKLVEYGRLELPYPIADWFKLALG